MGTRSLLNFRGDPKDAILVTVYRQFDGYLEGRGLELAEFLDGKRIVNGIPVSVDTSTMANGIGCLAAQWIALEKECVGNVYIYPPGADDCWEEYVYDVRVVDDAIEIEAHSTYSEGDGAIFKGSAADFIDYIKADADSEEEVA